MPCQCLATTAWSRHWTTLHSVCIPPPPPPPPGLKSFFAVASALPPLNSRPPRQWSSMAFTAGFYLPGVSHLVRDVLCALGGGSKADSSATAYSCPAPPAAGSRAVLLVGEGRSGKTAVLRDMAAELSSGRHGHCRVLVFDSFNEVGGDNLEPHGSLGLARRCQSADRWNQGPQMLDAVFTHKPDVFLVDELSTVEEAAAVRAIAGRGVAVVAAIRHPSLAAAVQDQNLCDLVGVPKGQRAKHSTVSPPPSLPSCRNLLPGRSCAVLRYVVLMTVTASVAHQRQR